MANCYLATDEFEGSLDIIEQVAHTLSIPAALHPTRLPITNAIGCSTVVLLSGYFESYLKNIIKEHIESLNGLLKPLTSIPLKMQLTHYTGGADALNWASKKDRNLKSTAFSQDLTRRLGSLDRSLGYCLAWESFANTKSNPGVDTVSTLLSGLEVDKPWPSINELVKTHGRLDVFLSSFMEMRNVCAHTGRHHTPPSGYDILDYVDKFRAIATCVDFMIEMRRQDFI